MGHPVQLGPLSITPPQAQKPIGRLKQDKAAWGVSGRGFFDDKDKLWQPGQALYFDGEPNLDLVPLNKIAYDRMQAFLDKLDAHGIKAAKKHNKEYILQARQVWIEDGDQPEIPTPDSIMGVKKDGNNEAIR